MKKVIAGIITYLIGATILLMFVVDVVAKIVLFTLLGLAGFLCMFGIFWLILNMLEDDPKGIIRSMVQAEQDVMGKKRGHK